MSLATSQVLYQAAVAEDVTEEHSIQLIADALKQLQRNAHAIFDKVEARVDSEHIRVQKLRHKVKNCQQKIAQLKGTKEAVQVISSSKYPVEEAMPRFVSLFDGMEHVTEASDISSSLGNMLPADDMLPFTPEGRDAVFDLWGAVALRSSAAHDASDGAQHGLGPLPAHLTSVSSMLLFNSRENPYKEYRSLDNMDAAEGARERAESKAQGMAEAPTTLGSSSLPALAAMEFGFQPKLKEAMELELPEDLTAALPDIAALKWESTATEDEQMLQQLVPSAFRNALPALPMIDDGGAAPPPSAGPPPPAASAAPSTAPPPPTASQAPPPPVAAPVPTPAPTQVAVAAEPVPAPVPAPAPAPAPDAPAAPSESAVVPVNDEPSVPPSGGGSSFLDQIKQGKKLKKAPKEDPAAKPAPKAADAGGGGLMGAILAQGKQLKKAKPAPKKKPELSLAEKIKAETQAKFKRRRARVAGDDDDGTPSAAGDKARRASMAVKVVARKHDTTPKAKTDTTKKPASASRGGLSKLSKLLGGGGDKEKGRGDAPTKRSAAPEETAPVKRSSAEADAPVPVPRSRASDGPAVIKAPAPAPEAAAVGPFNPAAFRGFAGAATDAGDASDGSASDWSEG